MESVGVPGGVAIYGRASCDTNCITGHWRRAEKRVQQSSSKPVGASFSWCQMLLNDAKGEKGATGERIQPSERQAKRTASRDRINGQRQHNSIRCITIWCYRPHHESLRSHPSAENWSLPWQSRADLRGSRRYLPAADQISRHLANFIDCCSLLRTIDSSPMFELFWLQQNHRGNVAREPFLLVGRHLNCHRVPPRGCCLVNNQNVSRGRPLPTSAWRWTNKSHFTTAIRCVWDL